MKAGRPFIALPFETRESRPGTHSPPVDSITTRGEGQIFVFGKETSGVISSPPILGTES